MEIKKKRRDRKDCKYHVPRGKVTAYCEYLGGGLQCHGVCKFYAESNPLKDEK